MCGVLPRQAGHVAGAFCLFLLSFRPVSFGCFFKKARRFVKGFCLISRFFSSVSAVVGSFGGSLYRLCRGQDDRPVAPRSARKSLSVETTFATDRADLAACRAEFPALIAELAARLAKLNRPAPIDKLFVKIRFDDFVHTTVECGGDAPDPTRLDALLARGWQRRSRPVRLLGVGVRFAEVDEKAGQLALFD